MDRWEPYAVKAGSATTTALPPIPMHCATIIALLTSLYTQCYSGAPPLSVNELKPGAVAGVGASVILSLSPPRTALLSTSLLTPDSESICDHLKGLFLVGYRTHSLCLV